MEGLSCRWDGAAIHVCPCQLNKTHDLFNVPEFLTQAHVNRQVREVFFLSACRDTVDVPFLDGIRWDHSHTMLLMDMITCHFYRKGASEGRCVSSVENLDVDQPSDECVDRVSLEGVLRSIHSRGKVIAVIPFHLKDRRLELLRRAKAIIVVPPVNASWFQVRVDALWTSSQKVEEQFLVCPILDKGDQGGVRRWWHCRKD